jgi:ATP-dependent Clp protease ATP-binding subunit ClpX
MKEDAPAFKAGLLEMGGASMPFIPRAQVGLGSKVKYHVFGIPAEDPDTVSKPGEGREIPEGKGLKEIKSPRQIYDELSRYMIGQEAAKKAVSVALFGHYQRISGKGAPTKSNILLYGPTGCGKTYLAELAAQLLDVPFIVVDATQYTETGYTGKDIEDMFKVLYKAAGRDEKKAARGIIFVDELDKLAGLDESASRQQRDVSGQGVQEGLLKAMEGGDYPGRPFSSQNVLFMAGGAFSQMDRICREHKEMGFLAKPWRERSAVPSVEDFVRFGMLPELMGRFQVTAGLHPLSEADLEKILAKPANSLVSQYQKAFAEQGITLDFAPEALKTVAARAAKLGTGARGLKAELERTVGPLMFEHFGGDKKVITVTPEMVC